MDRPHLVDLHVHLEGAIPLDALLALARRHDWGPRDLAALRGRLRFGDFAGFRRAWSWVQGLLRTPGDLAFAADAVARDLLREGVGHAELIFSPLAPAVTQGIPPLEIVRSIRSGLERSPGLSVALIADLVRSAGPGWAERQLEGLARARPLGLVGITLGGRGESRPATEFAGVYKRARALGLHTSVHAGETAGAASVRDALDVLGAERIGHGIRAIEDPGLVRELEARGTPLEVCPTSNVRTGVVACLADHPVRPLFDAGVSIAIGSDDPTLFETSLAREYRVLREGLDFTEAEIETLQATAARVAWPA